MSQPRLLRFFIGCLSLALFAALSAIGCDDAGSTLEETSSTAGTGGGASGTGGSHVGGGFNNTGGGLVGEGFTISPVNPILQVAYGNTSTTLQFTATDMSGETVPAAWSINTSVAGTISENGLFVASGAAGGKVEVTAKYNDDTAVTILSIHLTATENPGNVSPADQTTLMSPGGQSDPNWQMVYPYDSTVFPRGIIAPEVHLNGPNGATA